jgi:hypothetical protein
MAGSLARCHTRKAVAAAFGAPVRAASLFHFCDRECELLSSINGNYPGFHFWPSAEWSARILAHRGAATKLVEEVQQKRHLRVRRLIRRRQDNGVFGIRRKVEPPSGGGKSHIGPRLRSANVRRAG